MVCHAALYFYSLVYGYNDNGILSTRWIFGLHAMVLYDTELDVNVVGEVVPMEIFDFESV